MDELILWGAVALLFVVAFSGIGSITLLGIGVLAVVGAVTVKGNASLGY